MLPRHLIEEFWIHVRNHLVNEMHMNPQQARQDIEGYRTRLASHGVDEAIYHWDPKDIALAISRGGFRDTKVG